MTELLGLPGSGKTQLCLQLCASVQIPKELGGLDAEALYIDTNTHFTLSRFREILSATLLKCQSILGKPLQMTEDEALRKLHYVDAFGLEKFCAFMYRLPRFIAEHPKVKLIAIDSIAYPFKDGISTKQRTGLLFRQMAELQKTAIEHQIAVRHVLLSLLFLSYKLIQFTKYIILKFAYLKLKKKFGTDIVTFNF
ncbi:hypothetical protein B5X24_HaOG203987 [Helicoverpa armigera]|uniref:DNA repair protein RAD51 homolog 3 n=1 Tax=Helicoverpa armigera TaxID=29058 RepID=A0A2W1BYT5_HELAM|nr:hypothetical protein B5X24_HaOG203987 [Helicoverpa armigera]